MFDGFRWRKINWEMTENIGKILFIFFKCWDIEFASLNYSGLRELVTVLNVKKNLNSRR